MMSFKRIVLVAGFLALPLVVGARSHAEVIDVAANGFEVRESVHVAALPDRVFAELLQPAHWWSSDHTFSRSAANLKLDARAGGCWCESLPDGGSVEHMRVVYLAPGKALRLRGALGPLQGLAVNGAMTWSVKSNGSGSDISLSYVVGGYAKDGFDALAKAVDRVLGEQIARLKDTVDGAPRK
jgi:Polyketide cyclase / dehydrase and lipid transport